MRSLNVSANEKKKSSPVFFFRVGCYPYIKYHCTKRPVQDLSADNTLYRLITIANLGIPCLLYGLAAVGLIKHTETVEDEQTHKTVRIHFLIKEEHN
ncbi:unnamed protein product [Strongylus vulgaris]|uniref:Uncharacterized protein n=1 Tax=Strongylus vulgaris TaxID=40348 RepID=A0A3P7I664_STRVU|nr:unnamed protein product [Strongylus vulgaris]